MQTLKACITPLSAFGTLPKGDTLFGQLCWAVLNRHGEARLRTLIAGYTTGQPYAVVSDALPSGFLPRPVIPGHWFTSIADADRKAAKKRAWLPVEHFHEPVAAWLAHCKNALDIPGGDAHARSQPHNSINRQSGTTGDGFAPYSTTQHWYGPESADQGLARMDVHIVLDETRFTRDELDRVLADVGEIGFGRDASIGLGKFRLNSLQPAAALAQHGANAWLTLAPCAPQGTGLDIKRCFYQVFTRFGRHGDLGVHLGNPFKTPVLLANTGAVLAPVHFETRPFIGQGLGADGVLSKSLPQTVHQGYAPVTAIQLPKINEAA